MVLRDKCLFTRRPVDKICFMGLGLLELYWCACLVASNQELRDRYSTFMIRCMEYIKPCPAVVIEVSLCAFESLYKR